MKKKNLKSLKLNKKSISNFKSVHGGEWPDTAKYCGSNAATCYFTCGDCDFPTINDSCFSWCADICNDY